MSQDANPFKQPFELPAPPEWLEHVRKLENPRPMSDSSIIVSNLWAKGEVLLLGGHAKSWKSWALMDLTYCIGNGFGWLSWPLVNPGKVLHIDLELRDDVIDQRFDAIAKSYGQGNLDNIEILPLRGVNFTLNDFASLGQHLKAGTYAAISFDPTYRMLAGSDLSENDTGVITELMNKALWVATNLGCGMCILQHFSKGNQTLKRDLDAFSGSGVWGRAPDACLTFREHSDQRCYTVSANFRHWPQIEPFVAEFEFPRFRLRETKDPENLKVFKPNGRPVSFSIDDLCNLIEADENISYSNLFRRCKAAGTKSETTFKRRLKDAKTKGWLAIRVTDQTYFLTYYYVSEFRNNNRNGH